MVIGSTASGLDGIKGEYRPNLHGSSPNAIGDIKGEFSPNLYSRSWNTIGDIKGEFVPNFDVDRPNANNGGLTPPWLDALEYLLGY